MVGKGLGLGGVVNLSANNQATPRRGGLHGRIGKIKILYVLIERI